MAGFGICWRWPMTDQLIAFIYFPGAVGEPPVLAHGPHQYSLQAPSDTQRLTCHTGRFKWALRGWCDTYRCNGHFVGRLTDHAPPTLSVCGSGTLRALLSSLGDVGPYGPCIPPIAVVGGPPHTTYHRLTSVGTCVLDVTRHPSCHCHF